MKQRLLRLWNGLSVVRVYRICKRRDAVIPFGLIGVSTIVPMLGLLVLAMHGSWRAIPVAAAVVLLVVCAWRLMLVQASTRVKPWPSVLATMFLVAAMVTGLPCLAPIYSPSHSDQMTKLDEQRRTIVKDFEANGVTPGEDTGPAREIQAKQSALVMKTALTALVWQYTLLSGALACFHAGRTTFDTRKLISDIERPTTFVLAAVGLVVSALVVTLKVSVAMGAVAFDHEIAEWIDRRVLEAARAGGVPWPLDADTVKAMANSLASEIANWRIQVQQICALSIWELSLLASALSYFVASKLVPSLPSRRRPTPTWVYRCVAGLLVFGGSVAAFFTVIRAIHVALFWPVEIRWQL
jgi:hypothetical protein